MSKIKLFIFSGLFVCFLIPQTSDAYYTTKQQAIRFNDTTALFVIDYTFSLPESQGAMLPALAVRNQSELNNALIYEVLLDGKTVTNDGTATGVIISKNSSIQDGQFYVPAGEKNSFRLYVMFNTPATADEADYSLAIKSLPFKTIVDNEEINNALSKPELEKYRTAEIELNESSIPEVKVTGSVKIDVSIKI